MQDLFFAEPKADIDKPPMRAGGGKCPRLPCVQIMCLSANAFIKRMALLGVKLDDEGLFDIEIDVLPVRQRQDRGLEVIPVHFQPLGSRTGAVGFHDHFKLITVAAFVVNRDHIAGFYAEGGNVHPLTVNRKVTMGYQLSRFGTAGGKAQTIHYIVQTAFQQTKQVFTGHALLAVSQLKIMTELTFQNAVVALGLLLGTQLDSILRSFLASLTMLARCICSADHCTLVGIASLTLQEELLTFAAAKSANSIGISCLLYTSRCV